MSRLLLIGSQIAISNGLRTKRSERKGLPVGMSYVLLGDEHGVKIPWVLPLDYRHEGLSMFVAVFFYRYP